MFARRITATLMTLTALALAGCASAPQPPATHRDLLGRYTLGSVAMLDQNNRVVPALSLARTVFAQQLKGTNKTVDDAWLRQQDLFGRMFADMREELDQGLDGRPFLTLAEHSMTVVRSLFVPDAPRDIAGDLVHVTDVHYQWRDTHGTPTLLATGTWHDKPVRLQLYVLRDNRVFVDAMATMKHALGGISSGLAKAGVDKFGFFLKPQTKP